VIAHSIFVMKYWVVAKKINDFYSESQPRIKIEYRACLYLTCFMILITVSLSLDLCFMWNILVVIQDNKKVERYIFGLLTTAVPFGVLIFLIHAFLIMRNYHDKF
jgi:hypothetical protein